MHCTLVQILRLLLFIHYRANRACAMHITVFILINVKCTNNLAINQYYKKHKIYT